MFSEAISSISWRWRPSSPLIAGSSASYGPLWAEALNRAAGAELFAEMDELFQFWGLETLAPIGRPAESNPHGIESAGTS